jgi:hypothetical protein
MSVESKPVEKNSDIITLNVGGEKMVTRRSTLKRKSDSMLGRMFDENNESMMDVLEDGSYFLDSDPFVFRHILNKLRRCGQLGFRADEIPKGVDSEQWKAELDYYQLVDDNVVDPSTEKTQDIKKNTENFIDRVCDRLVQDLLKSHTYIELLRTGRCEFNFCPSMTMSVYNDLIGKDIEVDICSWLERKPFIDAVREKMNVDSISTYSEGPKRVKNPVVLVHGWPMCRSRGNPVQISIDRDKYWIVYVKLRPDYA